MISRVEKNQDLSLKWDTKGLHHETELSMGSQKLQQMSDALLTEGVL